MKLLVRERIRLTHVPKLDVLPAITPIAPSRSDVTMTFRPESLASKINLLVFVKPPKEEGFMTTSLLV